MNDENGLRVEYVVVGAIGAFTAAIATLYALTADEPSGVVMLFVTALLAAVISSYLWFQHRALERTGNADGDDAELYLPHASIWPFVIGLGAFFLANGLILGVWFVLPGTLVMIIGLAGHLRQSRLRS